MPNSVLPPEHWRERAEEARAIASQMKDPEAKAAMLEVAQNYDFFAERAAKLAGMLAKIWPVLPLQTGTVPPPK